jgi:signal transduction histidine kinase
METLRSLCQRLLTDLTAEVHGAYAIIKRGGDGATPELVVTAGGLLNGDTMAWFDLPLHDGESEIGWLRLGFAAGTPPPEVQQVRDSHALRELTALLSHARWEQMLASTSQAGHRILAVTEEEMQRIILDVHDGPVQKLFAASSQIEALQGRLQHMPEPARSKVEADLARIGDLVQTSLGEIKVTLGALRPPEFRRRPLVSVMQGLVMQHESLTGARVELEVVGVLPQVSLPVKIALYRILQEAMSNAYRHAGVDQMEVTLSSDEGWVILDVRDNGRGFEPPPLEGPSATELQEHIGLRGMRERAQLVNGHLTLTSHPGQGTHIQVRVPCDG